MLAEGPPSALCAAASRDPLYILGQHASVFDTLLGAGAAVQAFPVGCGQKGNFPRRNQVLAREAESALPAGVTWPSVLFT